jgi:hypothetical protein
MVRRSEDVDDEGDDEQDAHNRPDEVASSHVFSFLAKTSQYPEGGTPKRLRPAAR